MGVDMHGCVDIDTNEWVSALMRGHRYQREWVSGRQGVSVSEWVSTRVSGN